jgi:predicted DCC family thiol-disulfide oxidoreductase YuxK
MNKPERPLLIFDGDCSFCRLWIDYWWQITGMRVDYQPSQKVAASYPDIPKEQFDKSVVLILPGGEILSGAEAVFRSLAEAPGYRWLIWCYDTVPGFAPISEATYALIAAQRDLAYRVTVLLWGRKIEPASYQLTRWLFLRLCGLVYFFAFLSLAFQMTGLYGSRGVLPIAEYLAFIDRVLGPDKFLDVPSIFWLNSSDLMIQLVPWAGVAIAILLFAGVAQRLSLILLYALYLSIFAAGQEFMSYQWDVLLIETGFLAIFFAPGNWLPRWPSHEPEPSRLVVWLFRWLIFRLMLGSGTSKLFSGDPSWDGLYALNYHYWSQPLPTPLAWAAHQMPFPAGQISVIVLFIVELALPFLMFLPRRPRQWAAIGTVGLQVLIALTGNYGFFNLLTIVLCLPLLDDQLLRRFMPGRLLAALEGDNRQRTSPSMLWIARAACVVILLSSTGQFALQQSQGRTRLPLALDIARITRPYGISGTYGLFAVMTRQRYEIIIEGSDDGETWKAYEFKAKPGDVRRGLPVVQPFMPRLDWQMWFAALGDSQSNPWLERLLVRLLEGSPEVDNLLATNPFPDRPPIFVRAILYDYRFSTPVELQETGAWWQRQQIGVYSPLVSLATANPYRP